MIHIGLLHHLQKLARIGRERFDIAPLAFCIDGVKGEAGLARAGQARDDSQRIARNIDINALEVVLAGAPNLNMSQHGAAVPHLFRRGKWAKGGI